MDTPGNHGTPGAGAQPGANDGAALRERFEAHERLASERRKKGIAIAVALFLAFFLFFSMAANMLLLVTAGATSSGGGVSRVREKEVVAGGRDKIAIIPLDGVIMTRKSSQSDSFDMVTRFAEHLRKASEDDQVKGVILAINSPGGSVTPSDIMYNEVVRFKKKHGKAKPVVTLMEDVTASGGYYVAAPSDWIVAHPTTICGSVGVYMGYMRLEKLFKKLGVEEEIIKSGSRKDMGSPFRELTPEEKAIVEGMVAVVFSRFKEIVAKGRGDKVKMERIADGRVFIGEQAKEVGLVDEIGYLEDAVAKMKSLTGNATLSAVRYSTRVSFIESMMHDLSRSGPPSVRELVDDNYGQLLYLWRPACIQ